MATTRATRTERNAIFFQVFDFNISFLPTDQDIHNIQRMALDKYEKLLPVDIG